MKLLMDHINFLITKILNMLILGQINDFFKGEAFLHLG